MRLILLLPFLFATAMAQDTGSLIGRVTDWADDIGLPGANVFLEGTTLGAATDLDGVYRIDDIPAGAYTVTARFIGYIEIAETGVRIFAGDTRAIDFELEDDTTAIPCCLICYTRPILSRDIYTPRVVLGHDPLISGPCVCTEGFTIDLRSLSVGR